MKLLLFDLDGTLLNSSKTISNDTFKEINKIRKDYLIGVSTSRSEANSNIFLNDLKPDFLIASGGAVIRLNDDYIYKATFNIAETNELIKQIRTIISSDVEITVDTLNSHYWNYKLDPTSYDKTWGGSVWTNYNNFKEEALKICVEITDEKKAKELKEKLKNYDVLRFSDGYWYKITKSGVTKENAIRFISDKLNIKLRDMIAFGDDYADIGMLKMVGCGIAMGNAIDEVKEIADVIIDTNDNDGIAKYLKELERKNS